MSKPVKDLTIEHGSILLMLKVMKKVYEKLDSGEAVEAEQLYKMVEFIKIFADKCHHGKEEDILFPAILNADNSHERLINELLGEHKTSRDYIKGIGEALKNYAPGNPEAIHISRNMSGYVELLTNHIAKESKDLFPLVDKMFTAEKLEEIEKRFEDIEKNIIGEGKHEEYHEWLMDLIKKYS